jgi:hypothetical protein
MENQTKDMVNSIIYSNTISSNLSKEDMLTLNSLPTEGVYFTLKAIFLSESNRIIKSRAFGAMIGLEALDRVGMLFDLYKGSTIDWQIVYTKSLSQFKDDRAIKKLCEILLKARNSDLRFVAAESLAQIGDASSLPALEHAVQHDKGKDYEGFTIAEAASEAIKQIQIRTNSI